MNEIDQEEIAKRRGLYFPSFGIYGGVSGLYDYGPYGSRIRDNIIRIWKQMMLSEGNIAEYDGTAITQASVLKASGHYDRFFDYSVECKKCHTKYRADHIIEEVGFEVKLSQSWLDEKIRELNLKCKNCGGELGPVQIHKLMFHIDQGNDQEGLFLRPETAQGIFINFKEYYRFFREKLPFAIIQVGRGYRNEISPRKALYRLREFNMMECESFFDPVNEKWINEPTDKEEIKFLTNDGKELMISPKEAFEKGIIKSQPLAYFIGKSYQFFLRIGIDKEKLRYRQHKKDELSHYSSDTWDAEALTSIGWIEITGIAHRGNYDLSRHIEFSGRDLFAQRTIPQKKVYEDIKEIDFAGIRKKFGKDAASLIMQIKEGKEEIEIKGAKVDISEFISIRKEEKIVDRENFIPVVVEPSFGLDRIIYTVIDHNLHLREESGYNVLSIPREISPYDVAVLPLLSNDDMEKMAVHIFQDLLLKNINAIYDDSGSIGKRYARYDEVGITYDITIDHDTLKDNTVTLRHRDTKEQIRIRIEDIENKIRFYPWNGKIN
jgi:glycyl-tRNA synthetase